MKALFLNLNLGVLEDYSIHPKRYGGGAVFARWMKEFDDFSIATVPAAFDNITSEENKNGLIPLSPDQIARITSGEKLQEVAPETADFDLVIHHHTHLYVNTGSTKQLIWALGREEFIHPLNSNLLLYNDFQAPRIQNPDTKIFKFTLGTQLPPSCPRAEKEDFIFQCSRHVDIFNSIYVASFCLRHGIKGVFAGPIAAGYDLGAFIDGKTTIYLGEITEAEKLDWSARARLYTLIHNWPTPFSLSAIEALGQGTPVACTDIGFWPSLIEEGRNGYFVHNDAELLGAWEDSKNIRSADCYRSALPYSHHVMIDSLFRAFDAVLI